MGGSMVVWRHSPFDHIPFPTILGHITNIIILNHRPQFLRKSTIQHILHNVLTGWPRAAAPWITERHAYCKSVFHGFDYSMKSESRYTCKWKAVALQNPKCQQNCCTAAWRWRHEKLQTKGLPPNRLPQRRISFLKILFCNDTTMLPNIVHQGVGVLPLVEGLRTMVGSIFQNLGKHSSPAASLVYFWYPVGIQFLVKHKKCPLEIIFGCLEISVLE
mmetsp:Transcript_2686/g.5469  ORF Transcript_2686/g.5469 Transcript_2686/m.5469 type:complete len:217 (+) Transcript_2686:807-1457(+)